jgi:hypothetical protein
VKFRLFELREFSEWLMAETFGRTIEVIQNHHTWYPSYADFNGKNHFDLLHAMEDSHLERGFSEIGQNLTIFPDGVIGICRSFEKDPAGIKGGNSNAICIENLGDFDIGRDPMTDAQRNAIIETNVKLCRRFGMVPEARTIVYHHWYDLDLGIRTDGTGRTKSCPGTGFFGGNTIADAEACFLPLIRIRLDEESGNSLRGDSLR